MLTSLHNPLIKQLRKLHQPRERTDSGLFLVEGTHAVEAALGVHWQIEVICATEVWCEAHPALYKELRLGAGRFEMVSDIVIAALSDAVTPMGIVAALAHRERDWRELIAGRTTPTLLVLGETLQDPGNVGTIVRTCAAAGADGLILSADSADPEQPKVLRASAGAWFSSPPLRCSDFGGVLDALHRGSVTVIGADARAEVTLWQLDMRGPIAFVLGSEGRGLSPGISQCTDVLVRIPQQPMVESLNVGVSCALLLFEAIRQRRN